MTKKSEEKAIKILAIARNLPALNDQLNRIAIHCGTVGSSLVANALANNGHTSIDQRHLELAIQTSDGEYAITDNFILIDEKTQDPLFYSILRKINQATMFEKI